MCASCGFITVIVVAPCTAAKQDAAPLLALVYQKTSLQGCFASDELVG